MKTKKGNDMTDRIGLIYAETQTKLSGSIWLSVVCDENLTRQRRDWWYRCGLHQKWNLVVLTNQNKYYLWQKLVKTTSWPIV